MATPSSEVLESRLPRLLASVLARVLMLLLHFSLQSLRGAVANARPFPILGIDHQTAAAAVPFVAVVVELCICGVHPLVVEIFVDQSLVVRDDQLSYSDPKQTNTE